MPVCNNVLVLVAAYNGQQWLEEQIESILKQKNVKVHISISVDLSSDDTFELCSKFARTHNNIDVLPYGDSFGGAGRNFYRLIKDCDFSKFNCIAFSDQDDIWPIDKLSKALDKLEYFDCYSSSVTAFWSDGRQVIIDKAQPQLKWDFLFEAAGPGCTYVVRQEVGSLFKAWLLKNYNQVCNGVALHDWLIYAFARSNKFSWFIDSKPMMLYRQHANNQVGTNNSLRAAVKRFKLIKEHWYRRQIMNIAELMGLQCTDIYKRGLRNGYLGNIFLLCNINHLRRRFRDRFALGVFLLLNLF